MSDTHHDASSLPPRRDGDGNAAPVHPDATHCDKDRQLNDKQLRALDELAAGRTDTAVAASVGVHRTTVTRWRLYNAPFAAALNRRRAALRDASADRLRSMVTKALDRIEHEIEDGPDGAKIALKVIELANASTIGPTTTQDVAASIGKRHECTAGLRVLDVVRGMSRLDEEGDAFDDAETAPNDRTAAYGESRCR